MNTVPAAMESTTVVSGSFGPRSLPGGGGEGEAATKSNTSQVAIASDSTLITRIRILGVLGESIYELVSRSTTAVVRRRRGLRLVSTLLLMLYSATGIAHAQAWRVAFGDSTASWPVGVESGDVLGLNAYYQSLGYFFAHVDSVSRDSSEPAVHMALGIRSAVQSVSVEGPGPDRRSEVESILGSISGQYLAPGLVDSVAIQTLELYEENGLIGTVVELDSVAVGKSGLHVAFRVREGSRPVLLGLIVGGRTRASTRFLERVTGLSPGRRLTSFRPGEISKDLRDTGLFDSMAKPVLLPSTDSTAIVQLVLEDRAPGSFDFALGYLPPSGSRPGTVVGSGNLLLRNLFGGGRSISVELDRLPGQTSSLKAHFADPFVLGLDAGAEATFFGYQQDSTYSKQQYEIGLSFKLKQSVVTAHAVSEVSRPGTAGVRLENGQQLIPNSRARLGGLGFRFGSLGDDTAVGSGVWADIRVLRGRKTFRSGQLQSGDTLRVERQVAQDRIEASLRWRKPLNSSSWLVFGLDLNSIVSDAIDPSDLYRLGGAKTLRGYDEDRFRGETVSRALFELRRVIQSGSVAYGFLDVGVVGDSSAEERWAVYPGFGIGLVLESAAGLINVSYGMNLEDGPLAGRVHLGLAFGL